MRIFLQLAQTQNQHEQALKLLKKAYPDSPGAQDLWITKHHALPSTNTIVALDGDQVVGAITLFGENPFRLPCEQNNNLVSFQNSLGGRIAEVSVPGLKDPERIELAFALHHFINCFGASYCHYDAFVASPNNEWKNFYENELGYHPINTGNGETVFFRNARESADLRRMIREHQIEYFFPEKKFFLVAHQSMSPATLNHLFNQKTNLFSQLSDLEIRVLKNIYDHGDFANILPERKLSLPFKKEPKHRRFPMNCEGYLCRENGKKVQIQVLDVSKEGIKIQTEDPISRSGTFPLTISVGVMKQAEVIGEVVWSDDITQIYGLNIKSGCHHWKQLVDYLERESAKILAA